MHATRGDDLTEESFLQRDEGVLRNKCWQLWRRTRNGLHEQDKIDNVILETVPGENVVAATCGLCASERAMVMQVLRRSRLTELFHR